MSHGGESALQIVGAGPAGLAAAITAARAGARVVVHERAQRVGSRFHGDFQGLENWTSDVDALAELAGIGIRPPVVPFRHQVCFGPDGRVYELRSSAPFYYLVRRGPGEGTLDRALLREAEQAGAEVRFGSVVRELPPGGIYAGGPRRGEVIAAGYLFATDLPDGAWAALGDALAPGGYAYLLVQGGRGTLSVCLFRAFQDVKACLRRARALFERRLGLVMREPRPFGGVGNATLPATAVGPGGVLLAGEAAGFQDPLWGFGIRHAILSGHLAARAVVCGRPEDYDLLWRARLGGTIRASTVLRWFYGRVGDRGYRWLLGALAASPDPRLWLHRRYRPSLWKRALFPLLRGSALTPERGRRRGVAAGAAGAGVPA